LQPELAMHQSKLDKYAKWCGHRLQVERVVKAQQASAPCFCCTWTLCL
jgi:hypothetical protein